MKNILKVIIVIGLLFVLVTPLISSYSILSTKSDKLHLKLIEWGSEIEFTESLGKYDFIKIGEKLDASDGIDNYDVPKCPSPPSNYIRAYIRTNLENPYSQCWFEYRNLPKNRCLWIINFIWMPDDEQECTSVKISWNPLTLPKAEYKNIYLIDDDVIINMLNNNEYTFIPETYIPKMFKIYMN